MQNSIPLGENILSASALPAHLFHYLLGISLPPPDKSSRLLTRNARGKQTAARTPFSPVSPTRLPKVLFPKPLPASWWCCSVPTATASRSSSPPSTCRRSRDQAVLQTLYYPVFTAPTSPPWWPLILGSLSSDELHGSRWGGKRNAKKVTAGSPASSQSPAGAGMAGTGRQRAAGRSLLLLLPRQAASSWRRIAFNPFEEEGSLCSGWTEQEKNGSLVGFVLVLLLFFVVLVFFFKKVGGK